MFCHSGLRSDYAVDYSGSDVFGFAGLRGPASPSSQPCVISYGFLIRGLAERRPAAERPLIDENRSATYCLDRTFCFEVVIPKFHAFYLKNILYRFLLIFRQSFGALGIPLPVPSEDFSDLRPCACAVISIANCMPCEFPGWVAADCHNFPKPFPRIKLTARIETYFA